MRAKYVRVRFENVGRSKKTWIAEVRIDPGAPLTPDAVELDRALKAGGALMSSEVYCTFHRKDDGTQHGHHGTCHAGMHSVGTWQVVP